MKARSVLALTAFFGVWSPLLAEAAPMPKGAVLQQLGGTADNLFYVASEGSWSESRDAAKKCRESVETAKNAGAQPEDEIQVSKKDFPGADKKPNASGKYRTRFKHFEPLCRTLALKAVPAWFGRELGPAFVFIEHLSKADASDGDANTMAGYHGKNCRNAIEEAAWLGVTETDRFTVAARTMTLGEVRTQVCDKIAALGQQVQVRTDAANDAEFEAYIAPFEKAGAAGDRLEVIGDEVGTEWRVKGGNTVDDPKTIAKASVLCYLLERPNGEWIVRRFKFKGNKLTSKDDDTYVTKARAAKACR